MSPEQDVVDVIELAWYIEPASRGRPTAVASPARVLLSNIGDTILRRLLLLLSLVPLLVLAPTQTASASPASDFLTLAYRIHTSPVLVCIRAHESSPTPPWHDDGYGAVNWSGPYLGAYQFLQSTWNSTANHYQLPRLATSVTSHNFFVQDVMAALLYHWQGPGPWAGSGCG